MNYKIELTQQELHQIGGALAALPYAQVAPLMAKLQQQVTAQDAEVSAPAA